MAPFSRRDELEVVPERGLRRLGTLLQGFAHSLATALADAFRPLAPLRCNQGADFTGGNRTEHLKVPLSRLEGWRDARQALGLSTNDLLTAAVARALGRWSRQRGVKPGRTRLLLPVDVRPRDGTFASFANHLSSVVVTADLARPAPPLELAASIASQVASQVARRLPLKKLLYEAAVASRLRLGAMRRLVFDGTALPTSLSFSNLLPLGIPGAGEDGRWRGQGFDIDSLRITTPCLPRQGANVTVARYGDSACFNFNYKDSLLTQREVRELVGCFEESLAEVEHGTRFSSLPPCAS